jgi:hypothetical protein
MIPPDRGLQTIFFATAFLVFLPALDAVTPGTNAAVSDSFGKLMEPVPTESRRLALETAGAFENDGFRIRDGEWGASVAKGIPAFLQVTLFAGENYWFVAASPEAGVPLRVMIYDAAGKPFNGEVWNDKSRSGGEQSGSRSAVGVAPTLSGKYFVGVELVEDHGDKPVDFSLVYCYK